MSEDAQSSEEISVVNINSSSESDSVHYPESDADTDTTSAMITDGGGSSFGSSNMQSDESNDLNTFELLWTRLSMAISAEVSLETALPVVQPAAAEVGTALPVVQPTEVSLRTAISEVQPAETESPIVQPEEISSVQPRETSSETEPSSVQSGEILSGTEPSSVQPVEILSGTEPSSVQPVEILSGTEPSSVQPVEILSGTEPSSVQPVEILSGTEPSTVQLDDVPSGTSPTVVQIEEVVSSVQSAQAPLETEPTVIQPQPITSSVIPSPKRRRVLSPQKDIQEKKQFLDETHEDDSCSICFESWTTSGKHRPASLKCGHLFGFMCIEKWLKGNGEKCPQCNAKAKRADIRIIFTRNIKAVDTIERDRALEQLSQTQKRNTELMMETAQIGLKYQVAMSECNRLQSELYKAKEEIFMLRCKLNGNTNTSSSQFPCTQDLENIMGNGKTDINSGQVLEGKFVWEKTINIFEGGNCRVMTHSQFLGTIAVSQPSSVSLFPGFGIKKISSLDLRTTEYMTLHSKAIRNICFHPTYHDGVMLSCSLDKTVKLTSMISNTTVQVYPLPLGAWSCIWNTDDHNYFYVGLQNGSVQEYDIRNTESCVQELNIEGSRSPVASLQYVPASPNAHFRPGGLVVGQLNQVSFYEKIPGSGYKTHFLPLEGNISSLCFDNHTRQMLASFRSSANHPKVRHMVCELSVIDNTGSVCGCNTIQTFYGGSTQTLLSRSLLVPHPQNKDNLLVCASDEATQGVKIWNSNSFRLTQNVDCDGSVVDLCHIDMNRHYLLALTDKKLKFYKWKE